MSLGRLDAPVGSNIALAPDGSIVACSGGRLFRFSAAGEVDASFGNGGSTELVDNTCSTLRLTSTSTILVLTEPRDVEARKRGEARVFRFTSNGRLDDTFAGGKEGLLVKSSPIELSVTADGGFFLGGKTLARYDADGHARTGFEEDGVAAVLEWVLQVAPLPDGSAIAMGEGPYDQMLGKSYAMVRVRADGSVDKSFAQWARKPGETLVRDIAVLSDGSIVVVEGRVEGKLSKLTRDGRPDPKFGKSGAAIIPAEESVTPLQLGVAADGKLVVTALVGPDQNTSIIRFSPNGDLDASFGQGGRSSSLAPLAPTARPHGLTLAPNGDPFLVLVQLGGVGSVDIARMAATSSPP